MATILSNKTSTTGSPYAYYTVTATPVDGTRTANSIQIKVSVTWNLQYEASWWGTGYTMTAKTYLSDAWKSIVIKSSSAVYEGNSSHTSSKTFTVTGLTSTQTSITGIKFQVVTSNSAYDGGVLSSTNCSNLTIPSFTAPVQPSAPDLIDTSWISTPYIYSDGTWTPAISNTFIQ